MMKKGERGIEAPEIDAEWEEIDINKIFRNTRSFVSGGGNRGRLKVQYYCSGEKDTVYTDVCFGPYTEGPPGHVHGGCISAVLDETMGLTAWYFGHAVLSVSLDVKFLTRISHKW